MTSTVTETYLKAVFNAGEWSDRPVTVGALASLLGLAPSSASEQVRRLADNGLLRHARYGTVELTSDGRRIALATVRKHRIIETFLVAQLGYGWDEVHDEADILEHAVTDTFVERLAQRLGWPTHDPHGDPIPGPDGALPTKGLPLLANVPTGSRVQVARVWDDDPTLLRQLDELGITIGSVLTVTARGDAAIEIDNRGTPAKLDLAAARSIRVGRERRLQAAGAQPVSNDGDQEDPEPQRVLPIDHGAARGELTETALGVVKRVA